MEGEGEIKKRRKKLGEPDRELCNDWKWDFYIESLERRLAPCLQTPADAPSRPRLGFQIWQMAPSREVDAIPNANPEGCTFSTHELLVHVEVLVYLPLKLSPSSKRSAHDIVISMILPHHPLQEIWKNFFTFLYHFFLNSFYFFFFLFLCIHVLRRHLYS